MGIPLLWAEGRLESNAISGNQPLSYDTVHQATIWETFHTPTPAMEIPIRYFLKWNTFINTKSKDSGFIGNRKKWNRAGRRMDKWWYTQTMKYYSAIKTGELLITYQQGWLSNALFQVREAFHKEYILYDSRALVTYKACCGWVMTVKGHEGNFWWSHSVSWQGLGLFICMYMSKLSQCTT